jgi:hypothetical protein
LSSNALIGPPALLILVGSQVGTSQQCDIPTAVRARQAELATRTAAFIIPTVGNNYLRHEKL